MLTFYCCFTHMLSEIMNIILKQLLKQPRPENGAPQGGLFEGRYGMPSQHCHCFAYLITTALLLTFHYYKRYINSDKKLLVLTVSIVSLALQVFGRLYLRFHTLQQCLVGVAFGMISAIVFYSIGLQYFLPYSEFICRLWPLRWFGFRRDLVTQAPRFKKS
jgi:dolichyldiphosphatase